MLALCLVDLLRAYLVFVPLIGINYGKLVGLPGILTIRSFVAVLVYRTKNL